MRITVRALGGVSVDTIDALERDLARVFGCSVTVAPGIPNIDGAYHAGRRQYLGSGLLAMLRELTLAEDEKTLGVADRDLFAPDLNFVFGQADTGGKAAVISLVRLRQEFHGAPSDESLFRQRALKEAVHELGHTLGLGHCRNSRCVMHFSNALADTDFKEAGFCPECRPGLGL